MTRRSSRSVRTARRLIDGLWVDEALGLVAVDEQGEPHVLRIDEEGRLRVDAEVTVGDLQIDVDRVRLRDAADPDRMAAIDAAGRVSVDTGLDQPLTDAALRAAPVGVDTGLDQPLRAVDLPGEFPLPDGQAIALLPQTDALTDAELRAAPVPVDAVASGPTAYAAGTGGQTVGVPGALHAVSVVSGEDPATLTIDGGPLVEVPEFTVFARDFGGGLAGPLDVVIDGAASWYVDWRA